MSMLTDSRPPDPAHAPPGGRAPDAARPAPDRRPSMPAQPAHQAAAEGCLALVTVAVIASFMRVFAGSSFAWPLLVVAGAAHAGLALARRRGFGLGLTTALSALAFVFLASWLFFGQTTRYLFPTADTLHAAQTAVSSSWQSFQQVVAPAQPQPGFMLAAAFALYFAVFLADWAAFRLWAPIEALVPTLTLFGFATFVGSNRGQVLVALLYGAAAMLFVLEHRVAQRERTTTWLANQVERGSTWLVHIGVWLTIIAVAVAAVLAPLLPGANQAGILHFHGNNSGGSSRTTISPLVSIQSQLTKQADTKLFTVTSSKPAYWRLTSLDTFDGGMWRSSAKYDAAKGNLPGALPPGLKTPKGGQLLKQTFTISALAQLWLPAAYLPVAIDSRAFKVRYHKASSTLIVDTNLPNSDRQTYTVTSVLPDYTPAELRTASTDIPKAIKDDLAVPDLSDAAKSQAQDITAGARTPYDKAIALQDFFRKPGQFIYDPTVSFANDHDAIDTFLRVRRGYCQQFAGTYAAMARAVGLPTRVAVGFTPGVNDGTHPDQYVVKGAQAHAWPEVYLGQYGWVPFEPTPGRGAPGESNYLGRDVIPGQDTGNSPNVSTTSIPNSSTVTTRPATPQTLPPGKVNTSNPTAATKQSGTDLALWSVVIGLVLLAAALIYLIAVPSLLAWRRRQRRARAQDPAARVRVAWVESIESLALLGAGRRPDETAREFAARAGEQVPDESAQLAALADAADAATFGADTIAEPTAEAAEQTTSSVRARVATMVPRWRRALTQLDIRRVRADPH